MASALSDTGQHDIIETPEQCAWFLDFDGTLVEIADHPDQVEVPDALRELIAQLYEAAEGALAVITGRAIERLDSFLDPVQIPAAGVHGCQLRRHPGGAVDVLAKADIAPLHRRLRAFVREHPGTWLEDKTASVAIHYRGVPEHRGPAIDIAGELSAAHPGITVQHGKSVVELKPAGADKASAIERFMAAPPFAGRRPVFVGDDDSDEPAFRWVNRRGGMSIRVGEDERTDARFRLPDVGAVIAWLRQQLARTSHKADSSCA